MQILAAENSRVHPSVLFVRNLCRERFYILSVAKRQLLPESFWLLLIMWCLSKNYTDFPLHAAHTSASVGSLRRKSWHSCMPPPPSPVSTVGFILSVWTMTDEWRGCSIPSLVSTAKDIHKTANVVLILISYFYNITWQPWQWGWWVHQVLKEFFFFFGPVVIKKPYLLSVYIAVDWSETVCICLFNIFIEWFNLKNKGNDYTTAVYLWGHLVLSSCTFNPPICSDCMKEDQSWSDSSGEVKWVNEELIGTMRYACSFFWHHIAWTLTGVINSLRIGHMVHWNTHFSKALHLWMLTRWAAEARAEMCCLHHIKSQLSHLSVWWHLSNRSSQPIVGILNLKLRWLRPKKTASKVSVCLSCDKLWL